MRATETSKYVKSRLYTNAAYIQSGVDALVSFLYDEEDDNKSIDIDRISELVKTVKFDIENYEYIVREYVYRLEQEALKNS